MSKAKHSFKQSNGALFPVWEKRTLGELGTFMKGAPLSKADISDEGTPFLLYGELYTTYHEVTDNILRKTSAIVDEKYYSRVGDVVIPTSGETPEEISTATCVMVDGCILAGDLLIYRTDDRVDGRIMSYVINHQANKKIARIAQGKSVVHIQAKELAKIEVYIPTMEEQKRIIPLLTAVDARISEQEALIEDLEVRKKGLMQKIFSQELRFKADDGSEFPEWESKNIEDICVINPRSDEIPEEFYYMDLGSVSHGHWPVKSIVKRDAAPSRAQRTARLNDVFFQSVRPYNQGHYHVTKALDRKIVASTGYIQLRIKEKMDARFIYQQLYEEHFCADVLTNCTGSNYPAINSGRFAGLQMYVPCYEEQKLIADVLSLMDAETDNECAILDDWKQLKSGLLQQMFV